LSRLHARGIWPKRAVVRVSAPCRYLFCGDDCDGDLDGDDADCPVPEEITEGCEEASFAAGDGVGSLWLLGLAGLLIGIRRRRS
jgi:MYXO-CTERM domain-containing protein